MLRCSTKLLQCNLSFSPASKKAFKHYRLLTEPCHGAPKSYYDAESGAKLPATSLHAQQIVDWVMLWCCTKWLWCNLWLNPASGEAFKHYRLLTESCHGAPQSWYDKNSSTDLPATKVCMHDKLLTESCHGDLQSYYDAISGSALLAKK